MTDQTSIPSPDSPLTGDHPGFDEARAAADTIARATGVAEHRVAVVLGSGWGEAAGLIGDEVAAVPLAEVPGFHAPKVPGHNAVIRSVRLPDGTHALVFGSRTHFYESRDAQAVAHTVRTAAAAGARTVVLTNAAGGLRDVAAHHLTAGFRAAAGVVEHSHAAHHIPAVRAVVERPRELFWYVWRYTR